MTIKLPNIDPKRELARKICESILSQAPLIGPVAVAVLSVTNRAYAEQEIQKWQRDVTLLLNNIEKAISDFLPAIKLSDSAAAVGLWISRNSATGREDSVDFEMLMSAFSDATKLELEDACGELELENLTRNTATFGNKIKYIRPTSLLFEIFDPIAFQGSDPRIDAAHLARFVVGHNDTVSANDIVKHFGWDVRRYNPAISIVCEMIASGRKSAESHPEFLVRFIMPNPTERAALRRFADSIL